MKNPYTRWFYSALGAMISGGDPPPAPEGLPLPMLEALGQPFPGIPEGRLYPGAELTGNRCRRIYGATWEQLRERGFRRPGRFQPWPGVELYLPFVRGLVGVTPQGLSGRVPHELRGLALAGKGLAAASLGMRLVVVCARVEPAAWRLMATGGCAVCTPGTLPQALYELDFLGTGE